MIKILGFGHLLIFGIPHTTIFTQQLHHLISVYFHINEQGYMNSKTLVSI